MLKTVKKVICTVLTLMCISSVSLTLTACDDSEGFTEYIPPYDNGLHIFDFNYPDNIDSLSVEEQLAWARENGFLIIKDIGGKIEVENFELLENFLENKEEKMELLIMTCKEYDDNGLKNYAMGLYFDGEYYQVPALNEPFRYLQMDPYFRQAFYKFEKCGIERYRGKKYLYVQNDRSLSVKDALDPSNQWNFGCFLFAPFDKKYYIVAEIK